MQIETKQFGVSVILTLFNSKEFYMRALNSILNQSFADYEILIVDDGSTDGIEVSLFPILKKCNFIKYVRHPNRKHPLSLNTGIKVSSGSFISFIDSDDEYEADFLKKRMNFFLDYPETDLLYSPARLVGDEKNFYVPDANDVTRLIHINDCIIGGTFFGRRNVFEELGGFSDVYSHDSDFLSRASSKFKTVKFDSADYIYHRDNPESITNKMKSFSELK